MKRQASDESKRKKHRLEALSAPSALEKAWISKALAYTRKLATEELEKLLREGAIGDKAHGPCFARYVQVKAQHPHAVALVTAKNGQVFTYGVDAVLANAFCDAATKYSERVCGVLVAASRLDEAIDDLCRQGLAVALAQDGAPLRVCSAATGTPLLEAKPLIGVYASGAMGEDKGALGVVRLHWGRRAELLPELGEAEVARLLKDPRQRAQPLYAFGVDAAALAALGVRDATQRVERPAAPPELTLDRCAQLMISAYASELQDGAAPAHEFCPQSGRALARATAKELLDRLHLADYLLPSESKAAFRRASHALLLELLAAPPPLEAALLRQAVLRYWLEQRCAPPQAVFPTFRTPLLSLRWADAPPARQQTRTWQHALEQLAQLERLLRLAALYEQSEALPLIEAAAGRCLPRAELAPLRECLAALRGAPLALADALPPALPPQAVALRGYWEWLGERQQYAGAELGVDATRLVAACEQLVAAAAQLDPVLKVSVSKDREHAVGIKIKGPAAAAADSIALLPHPRHNKLCTTAALLAAEQRVVDELAACNADAERRMAELQTAVRAAAEPLQRSWDLVLLAQTLYEHACHATRRGWALPQLGAATLRGIFWPFNRKASQGIVRWTLSRLDVLLLTGS